MQVFSLHAGMNPAPSFRMKPRVVVAVAAVAAIHAALLAVALRVRNENAQPLALESHTITAELLRPEAAAAPAAIQSTPEPKPAPPVVREKTKTPPKPQQKVVPKPAPTPLPQTAAPSAQDATPAPAPAATPAPATTPAAPSSPAAAPSAPARPAMALNAPRNVSHLDCRIAQPDYPALSKRRGETGIAYVRFVVGLTGSIENVELKKSSGYSRLDDAALDAMRDSTCKPYLENGEPVRAAYTQPFDFSLHD